MKRKDGKKRVYPLHSYSSSLSRETREMRGKWDRNRQRCKRNDKFW